MGTDGRTDKPADFAVTDGINNVRHLPRACLVGRLAVDMDFHVWISDLGYTVDISNFLKILFIYLLFLSVAYDPEG